MTQPGSPAERSTASVNAGGTRRATTQYPPSSTLSTAARYRSPTNRHTAARYGSQNNDQSTAERDEVDYISEPHSTWLLSEAYP